MVPLILRTPHIIGALSKLIVEGGDFSEGCWIWFREVCCCIGDYFTALMLT